jgi:HEAT repeat protein
VAGLLRLEAAAPPLLARASAGAPDARGPFLEALRAIRMDPAELTRLVSTVSPAHRQKAVRLAWQVGGTSLLPHLPTLLGDSAGPVRMAVIEILTESGDPAAPALARERLEVDSSAAVRATAIHALTRAEPNVRQEALTKALADPDPDVRATAVEALTGDVEETAGLLAPAFRDADERVWRASLPHLVALPDQDLVVVWDALREGPPVKREELVRVIEALDPDRLIDLAVANTRAASPADRVLASELAARAGSPEAADLVVGGLEDPDPQVRRTSAAAMSTLRAPAAVPALAHSLSDPQVEVRIEAIQALGLIDDDTVPDILIGALRDPEVRVRETAADALARWHSPAVARRLSSALSAPDLRRSAADVLERMGDMATEALAAVAGGPDQEAAAAAGELLERVVGPRPFVEELASIDPDRRLQAVRVLARIGGPTAAEALVSALTDPDVGVRSLAATSLGAMGYLPSLKRLRRMFLTDPVAEAAQAAETALRGLGVVPTDPESSPPPADPGDDLRPPEG